MVLLGLETNSLTGQVGDPKLWGGRKSWSQECSPQECSPQATQQVMVAAAVQLPSLVRLCDPVDCSTSGSSVLYYLQEFVQIHIYWVGDDI